MTNSVGTEAAGATRLVPKAITRAGPTTPEASRPATWLLAPMSQPSWYPVPAQYRGKLASPLRTNSRPICPKQRALDPIQGLERPLGGRPSGDTVGTWTTTSGCVSGSPEGTGGTGRRSTLSGQSSGVHALPPGRSTGHHCSNG